jgi:general secretion pathway protein D
MLKKLWLLMFLFALPFVGVQAKTDPVYMGDIEFKDSSMQDAVRILSELSGRNVIVTKAAADNRFSMFIRQTTLEEAIESMCRITGLWYRKSADTGNYIVMTDDQFREDVLVYRNETTKTFNLQHQNVVSAANAIQALFGQRVTLQEPQEDSSYQFDGDMGTGVTGQGNLNSESSRFANNRFNQRSITQTSTGVAAIGGAEDELSGNLQRMNDGRLRSVSKLGDQNILEGDDLVGNVRAAPIRITYNNLHNLLLVRSSDEKALQDIESLIVEIDKPAKQVLLQMKIMRVYLGEDENSVFDFQYASKSTTSGPNSSLVSNPLGGDSLPNSVFGMGMAADQLTSGSLVFQLARGEWLAKLAFLETQNRTKLVSTPLIMASNNKEAEIFIGEERPLVEGFSVFGGVVSDGVIQPSYISAETSLKEVGTKLKIWPRINADATVTLDIEQEISSINLNSARLPVATESKVEEYNIDTYSTTSLNLTAVAKHGQTIAIGGLIEESKDDQTREIPGINKIPVLKDVLSSEVKGRSRSELVILIKPYIYDSAELANQSLQSLQQELETEQAKEEVRRQQDFADAQAVDLQKAQQLGESLQALLQNQNAFGKTAMLQWSLDSGLSAVSLGESQQNGVYFYHLQIQNHNRSSVFIDQQTLGNKWLGAAWIFADGNDKALIRPRRSQHAIVISDKPLQQVLNAAKQDFRLLLGSRE